MKVKKSQNIKKLAVEYWQVYVMLIPLVAFYLIFAYFPMYGIVISFKDYYASKGILGSPWYQPDIFAHFKWIFSQPGFTLAFRNTIVISILKLVFCFPVPIILALFLNEIKGTLLKRSIQTAVYLPNFISWVIIASIMYTLFAVNGGVVNNLLAMLNLDRINFLTNENYFYPMLILAEIWKGSGWGAVIYLSAISAVNQDLYEAATVDGCGRFRRMRHVTMPVIAPIVLVMFILALGNIMNAGFDPIFNLYNKAVINKADILDTFAYTVGIANGFVERGAALGLFKTVINFAILISANFVVKRINGRGIYA